MTDHFLSCFEQVLRLEDMRGFRGRAHTDAGDPGGETKWGITEGVWTQWLRGRGVAHRPVSEMTEAECMSVYKGLYWDSQGLDELAAISPAVAGEVFEAGVNCGPLTAGKFLQRASNVVWRPWGEGLLEDGRIGVKTRGRVADIVTAGFERALVAAQNGEQYFHYKLLITQKPWATKFARGWLQHRLDGINETRAE